MKNRRICQCKHDFNSMLIGLMMGPQTYMEPRQSASGSKRDGKNTGMWIILSQDGEEWGRNKKLMDELCRYMGPYVEPKYKGTEVACLDPFSLIRVSYFLSYKFFYLERKFYRQGQKAINIHMVHRITETSMAFWYMLCGTLDWANDRVRIDIDPSFYVRKHLLQLIADHLRNRYKQDMWVSDDGLALEGRASIFLPFVEKWVSLFWSRQHLLGPAASLVPEIEEEE